MLLTYICDCESDVAFAIAVCERALRVCGTDFLMHFTVFYAAIITHMA